MNKRFLLSLIPPFIIGSILGIISYYVLNPQETKVEYDTNQHSLIFLPVEINGKTYKFLWDTGTSQSLIFSRITKEVRANATNISGEAIPGYSRKKQRFYLSDNIKFKIGRMEMECPMLIDSIRDGHFDERMFDGIIGGNIINNYDWLIDTEKNEVRISRKISPPSLQEGDFRHEMEISFHTNIPFCNTTLNDSLPVTFFFDSGRGGAFLENEEILLNQDLCFEFSDTCAITHIDSYFKKFKPQAVVFTTAEGNRTGLIFENLSISGYNTQRLFASVKFYTSNEVIDLPAYDRKLPIDIILTANFLRRFKQVYYCPREKKISFIHSPTYKGYSGENIPQFLNVLQHSIQRQQGHKTEP